MKYLAYISILLFLVGCTNSDNISNNLSNVIVSDEKPIVTDRNDIRETNQNKLEEVVEDYYSVDERAELIGKEISNFENVEKISVVISGDFAIVGITLNEEIEDDELIKFKRKISNKIKFIDKETNFVSVTTTPTLVEKVYDMADFKIDEENIENEDEIEIEIPEHLKDEVIELTPNL